MRARLEITSLIWQSHDTCSEKNTPKNFNDGTISITELLDISSLVIQATVFLGRKIIALVSFVFIRSKVHVDQIFRCGVLFKNVPLYFEKASTLFRPFYSKNKRGEECLTRFFGSPFDDNGFCSTACPNSCLV